MTMRKLNGPLGGEYITDNAGNTVVFATNPYSDDSDLGGRLTVTEYALTNQAVGLSQPNPGTFRYFPVAGVMADDPTITAGDASGATVITNSVLVLPDSGKFTYRGCLTGYGTFFSNANYYSPNYFVVGANDDLDQLHVAGAWSIEFDWYGAEFELLTKGQGDSSIYRLTVNNEGYDVRVGRADTAANGESYLIHYDFGSAAFRRIRFDCSPIFPFGGIRTGPADTIWPSSRPIGPKVIVTGDSFADVSFNYWPALMGELLGWGDVTTCGKGSTGYLDESAGNDTMRDRAQLDIYNQNPDIVVVSGGINDSGNTDEAAVGAEAATFYAEIKANLPDCVLIVSGMQWPDGDPADTALRVAFAIRDAAIASEHVDCYIDQLGLGDGVYSGAASDYVDAGWMTGTGKEGTTAGDGNADVFTSSDGTHPTQAGHDYRAWRHAQAIAAAMPIIGA
jgi:hypothetical protein